MLTEQRANLKRIAKDFERERVAWNVSTARLNSNSEGRVCCQIISPSNSWSMSHERTYHPKTPSMLTD